MLLNQLIEQLNLPTLPVEFRDSKSVELSVIGYEPVNNTCGEILIYNHPEGFRVFSGKFVTCQSYHLITYYTGFQIGGAGVFNSKLHVVLSPGYEERSFCMDKIEQAVEINVPFIHYVNSSGLDVQFVQQSDIVDKSLGQVYINWQITPEIQQSVHLDTTFTFPESSPWAQLQAVLDITKTVSLSELSKAHNIEMITASEITNPMIPIVSGNTFIEFVFWHHRHKLCKNCFPVIHGDYLYDLAIKVNFESLKKYNFVTN